MSQTLTKRTSARKTGISPEAAPTPARAPRRQAAQLDAAQEKLFDLMLADLDARIDAVAARTDRIMASAGLV